MAKFETMKVEVAKTEKKEAIVKNVNMIENMLQGLDKKYQTLQDEFISHINEMREKVAPREEAKLERMVEEASREDKEMKAIAATKRLNTARRSHRAGVSRPEGDSAAQGTRLRSTVHQDEAEADSQCGRVEVRVPHGETRSGQK